MRTVTSTTAPLLAAVAALPMIVSAFSAERVRAEDRPARLVVDRGADAEACPTPPEIAEAVSARLGHDPFSPDASTVVEVQITRDGQAWAAHLQLRDGATVLGERHLEARARTCRPLMMALEVAIAIALDPIRLAAEAAEPASDSDAAATHGVEAPVEPAATVSDLLNDDAAGVAPRLPPPVPDPVPVGSSQPVRFRGHLGAHLALGSAPAVAVGAALAGGIRWRAFSIVLEARADLPASSRAASGGIETSLLLAALVPCAHIAFAFGCLEVAGGVLRAEGVNLADAQRVTSPSAWVGGQVGVELPRDGPVRFRGGIAVTAALTRTSLVLGDGTLAWRTHPVSARLFAGAVVEL